MIMPVTFIRKSFAYPVNSQAIIGVDLPQVDLHIILRLFAQGGSSKLKEWKYYW